MIKYKMATLSYRDAAGGVVVLHVLDDGALVLVKNSL